MILRTCSYLYAWYVCVLLEVSDCVIMSIFLPSDLDLTLTLINSSAVINITEPLNTTDVTLCFGATVTVTRRRDAVFYGVPTNSTTLLTDEYALPYPLAIIVQAGFDGEFLECFSVIIYGDDLIEDLEVLEIVLRPELERDRVELPSNATSIVINIEDDDGENLDPCMDSSISR